ncbi:MAG: hypothetical protein R3200_00645, partial [Xanthomonadales bacterium]|nr:hypothetical protein [Xanthomonadales bacterium]
FEVVIHALLLHYALLGVRALGQRVLSRDVSTAAGCLLLAVALATGGRMAWRLVEPVPPRLETYRISGDWLLRTSREAALDELAATDGIIRFLAGLRGRIPRRECVYTIAPHLVFHYARAATVSYPAGESIARLNQCNLALALGLSAVQYQLPPYHPLQWLPNPEVLAASAPGPDGTPVALLVRLPDFQDAP